MAGERGADQQDDRTDRTRYGERRRARGAEDAGVRALPRPRLPGGLAGELQVRECERWDSDTSQAPPGRRAASGIQQPGVQVGVDQ